MRFAVAFSILFASYVAVEGTYDLFPDSHFSSTYIPTKSNNDWIALSGKLKDFSNDYGQVYGIVDSISGSYPSFYRQITKIPVKGGITIVPAPKNLGSFSNALYLEDYSSVNQVPHIKVPPLDIYGKLGSSGYLYQLKNVPVHFISSHRPQTLSYHTTIGLSPEIHYDGSLLNYDSSQLRSSIPNKNSEYNERIYRHGIFGSRYVDEDYHHGNYGDNQESLISPYHEEGNLAIIPHNHQVHEISHQENSGIPDKHNLEERDHSVYEENHSAHESEPEDGGEILNSHKVPEESLHDHGRDLGSGHFTEHKVIHQDDEEKIYVDEVHDQIIGPIYKKYVIPTIAHFEEDQVAKYPIQEEIQEDDLKIQRNPSKLSGVSDQNIKLEDYDENQKIQNPTSDVKNEHSDLQGGNYGSEVQQEKQSETQPNYEASLIQKDKEELPSFPFSNAAQDSYDGKKYTGGKNPILSENVPIEQNMYKPAQTVKPSSADSSDNEQKKYDQQEKMKDYKIEQSTITDGKTNYLPNEDKAGSYEQISNNKNSDYKFENEQSGGRSKQYRKYEKPRSSSYEIEILHSNRDGYQHSTPYEQFSQVEELTSQLYPKSRSQELRKQSQPTEARQNTYQENSPLEQKQVFTDGPKERKYLEHKFIYTEQKQDTKDSVEGYNR
ncbi:uncharacterized protein LOC118195787 [Stegodyphus dumicola]|uniref:uncharacterized protein LOC118195787 n=1 Tax=Stegodyphus dumicola TaxID=202533 RepID=UPI0015B2CEE5|nr:uncharacterized protein LOC118195787 [Stegodyphus dumicola]